MFTIKHTREIHKLVEPLETTLELEQTSKTHSKTLEKNIRNKPFEIPEQTIENHSKHKKKL